MYCVFFLNDTATTEIYTLSLHDALPISLTNGGFESDGAGVAVPAGWSEYGTTAASYTESGGHGGSYRLTHYSSSAYKRSEEHTSELQSHVNLVCRVLLEKKKKIIKSTHQ